MVATVETEAGTPTTYYNHPDHLTGSNVVTNEQGSVEQLVDYYPFGGIRLDEKSGGFDEQRKFTGHEYDEDTNLHYYVQRYYNQDVGRFVSQDSVFLAVGTGDKRAKVALANPQALNSYSYVVNNPLKYVDEEGEFAQVLIGAGAGIVGQYGYDVISNIAADGFSAKAFYSDLSSLETYGVRAVQGGAVALTGGAVGGLSLLGQMGAVGVTSGVTGALGDAYLGQSVTPQSVLIDTTVGAVTFGALKSVPQVPGRLPNFGTQAFFTGKHTQQSALNLGVEANAAYLSKVLTGISSLLKDMQNSLSSQIENETNNKEENEK